MTDKTLENEYLHIAAEYVGQLFDENETAKVIGWIGYGLDMREGEVEALKARILELGG